MTEQHFLERQHLSLTPNLTCRFRQALNFSKCDAGLKEISANIMVVSADQTAGQPPLEPTGSFECQQTHYSAQHSLGSARLLILEVRFVSLYGRFK